LLNENTIYDSIYKCSVFNQQNLGIGELLYQSEKRNKTKVIKIYDSEDDYLTKRGITDNDERKFLKENIRIVKSINVEKDIDIFKELYPFETILKEFKKKNKYWNEVYGDH
jgi:hypothetical protein